MSIYIITAREHGVAKIGFSADPKRRAINLATANFAKVELEAVIPGDVLNERELHKMFSNKRRNGEWFEICRGIESLIMKFKIGSPPKVAKVVIGESYGALDQYLKTGKMSATELAGLTGLTPASISRIRRGEQNISRDTMLAITAATGGKVTANDLVSVVPV